MHVRFLRFGRNDRGLVELMLIGGDCHVVGLLAMTRTPGARRAMVCPAELQLSKCPSSDPIGTPGTRRALVCPAELQLSKCPSPDPIGTPGTKRKETDGNKSSVVHAPGNRPG